MAREIIKKREEKRQIKQKIRNYASDCPRRQSLKVACSKNTSKDEPVLLVV